MDNWPPEQLLTLESDHNEFDLPEGQGISPSGQVSIHTISSDPGDDIAWPKAHSATGHCYGDHRHQHVYLELAPPHPIGWESGQCGVLFPYPPADPGAMNDTTPPPMGWWLLWIWASETKTGTISNGFLTSSPSWPPSSHTLQGGARAYTRPGHLAVLTPNRATILNIGVRGWERGFGEDSLRPCFVFHWPGCWGHAYIAIGRTEILWRLNKENGHILQLQISQPPPIETENVYDIVQWETSTAIALPILRVLLQHPKESWAKPASVLVSSLRLDHMYRVQQEGAEFLFAHPKLNHHDSKKAIPHQMIEKGERLTPQEGSCTLLKHWASGQWVI